MTPEVPLLELIAQTPFAHLGPEGSRSLAALFRPRRLDKGAVVFLEGETGGSFFVVADGRLKAFRRLPDGREITVFVIKPREFFGFLPLLDGGPRPLSVEALEPSAIQELDRAAFLGFIHENPTFCTHLMAYLAGRLRGCLDQLSLVGQQGALDRTARGLLALVESTASGIGVAYARLPFTQEEFARTLHLAPENLSRALARLRREGLIEREGRGCFRLLDVEELRRIAGE
ncbi:MAG: Crp/Fnr family transcriptional regulator [Acidobacteriota bacterium]